jgi:alanyl-tRNA synthetase
MRRAIRHGRLMGATKPFLHKMVDSVRNLMGGAQAYPELLSPAAEKVPEIVLAEEKRFLATLSLGLTKLDEELVAAAKQAFQMSGSRLEASEAKHIEWLLQLPHELKPGEAVRAIASLISKHGVSINLPGDRAFRLYDTYGLPLDFIRDSTRDLGVLFDESSFESAMEEQRTRARASWKGGSKEAANPAYAKLAETFKTEPDFYCATQTKDCCIEAILTKDGPVKELKPGETGEVVLDRTVIYAESGGQMADTGGFYDNSGTQLLAEVTGAYYPVSGLVAHRVKAKETLRVCDRVTVVADAERRARIMRNHTGTHLVHAALRNILGTHVKQAGSLNAPDRLRFDFSHFAPVGQEELRDIEQQVNDEIRVNTKLETNVTSLEEALNSGALAFFGDKYPESNVRVVTIPDPHSPRGFYSKELCGGTHVTRGGDIGVLKIVSEESVAAGVRRIEAVTGIGAMEHYQNQAQILHTLAGQLNVAEDSLLASVEKLSQTARQLEKELADQKRKGALNQLDDLYGQAQTIKGVKTVVGEVANVDREGLRQLVDSLRQKLGSGVVALGMPEDGKVALIVGVTKDLTAKVHAGKLIQALAKQVGGSGGGRPDLAEAGGKDTSALKSALQSVPSLLEPLL